MAGFAGGRGGGRGGFADINITPLVDVILVLLDARVQTEREVYVRADKDARYGDVARVVAAAQVAGVDGINLTITFTCAPDSCD